MARARARASMRSLLLLGGNSFFLGAATYFFSSYLSDGCWDGGGCVQSNFVISYQQTNFADFSSPLDDTLKSQRPRKDLELAEPVYSYLLCSNN